MSTLPPGIDPAEVGIIIVDHGSKRAESNDMLLEVVALFERSTNFDLVEPAHMELAGPSIKAAFDRCVQRGARFIVVFPYFLLPGRHWDQDIPALAAKAAQSHDDVRFLVTAPFGLHPLMTQIIAQRIDHCLHHAVGNGPSCDVCEDTDKCRVRNASEV